MNILLLTQFFSTTRGGGEYVFSIIAKKLAENNHRVFVITSRISGEVYPDHKNIQVIFVPPVLEYKGGLPPGFLDNIRYTINAIRKGLKVIKKEKIDIIHSNNFSPSLAGAVLSYITSKQHIITVHDIFSLCGRNYWKKWGAQNNVSRINVFLAPFFEKLMLKLRCTCIHTVSETTKEDLIKFGARKPIHVIHNSIELNQNIQNFKTDIFQFIYIGRLVFYKNLEVVIKAVELVRKSEPKIKLIIAGGGPYLKTLEDLVRNLSLEHNVEFRGHVSEEEKIRLIGNSVALVFPSLCEGFGLVILEAFSQNKPVLVSDIRPMLDIVSHDKTGYVLNPFDETVWAEHLLKIINDPQNASYMGRNGNQLLNSLFNQESMYKKILQMYLKCIDKKNSI